MGQHHQESEGRQADGGGGGGGGESLIITVSRNVPDIAGTSELMKLTAVNESSCELLFIILSIKSPKNCDIQMVLQNLYHFFSRYASIVKF